MSEPRRILLVSHTRRADALAATHDAILLLRGFGIIPVLPAGDDAAIRAAVGAAADGVETLGTQCQVDQLELAIVLGGDGTILRAADIVRSHAVPVVGVNLGHMGFLAESDRHDLIKTITRVADGDYHVEERLALDVDMIVDGEVAYSSWALNEVTVEKAPPAKMIELLVLIDGEPLTSFGADGVVVSTPTGSTAYSFSAGGPIVWPNVDALLFTPLNAHALFARSLVLAPSSVVTVNVVPDAFGDGVIWCDGSRNHPVPAGAAVRVRASAQPVKLARLSHGSFAARLVGKFNLPTEGLRGRGMPVGTEKDGGQ